VRTTTIFSLANILLLALLLVSPQLALAQASPFMTGATALQTNILAWLTPVAIILVMPWRYGDGQSNVLGLVYWGHPGIAIASGRRRS